MDLNLFKYVKLKGYFLKLIGTMVIFVIALVGIILIVGKQRLKPSSGYILSIMPLVINLALLIITLGELKKNNINIKDVIGRPKKKSFIFEVPISLILTYIAGIGMILILLYIVYRINPGIVQNFNKGLKDTYEKAPNSFIMTIDFVDTVLLAPILEEIIFRGILLSKLYNKYGIIRAIIFTSGIFFMIHFRSNPMTFAIGITNCILVLKYKSLIPAIICHGLNNLFVFMKTMGNKVSSNEAVPFEVNIAFLITGMIMIGIYALYIYKNRSYIRNANLSKSGLIDYL
ncbi:CPBP family intramembrane metalloprotease [Clostridium sp. PL3]|uniref:CPBP family intramembrane metalloprotease n=1 Tax=Clostridium thailandense TaxID=2794346 RepID=A0A949TSD7_9CLOT|nr:type II CAAX endopeptidase family protein [Clostridium thailandense]MBV7272471.1 CPBP family intramembrane metalloprotease [Clostridium thailandense]